MPKSKRSKDEESVLEASNCQRERHIGRSSDEYDNFMLQHNDPDLEIGSFSREKLMIGTEDYDRYGNSDSDASGPEAATTDSANDVSGKGQDDDSDATGSSDSTSQYEDDSRRSLQPAGRYFSDVLDTGPTCHNCGKSGHIARECGDPSNLPCFLCGQTGHSRSGCPNDLCYNCLRPGHQSRECTQPKRRRFIGDSEVCNRCGLPGHVQRDCSLSWRQYVFKKKPLRDALKRQMGYLKMSCYNCGSAEHFGDECPHRSRAGYSIFHRPEFEYVELVAYRSGDPVVSYPRSRSSSPRRRIHRNMTLSNIPSGGAAGERKQDSRHHGTSHHYGHIPHQYPNFKPLQGDRVAHVASGHRPLYRGGYRSTNDNAGGNYRVSAPRDSSSGSSAASQMSKNK